ncbi:unnamed protein product [Orchesella dallaii]|uniref:Uncharacterized protein n=1 Tax=Orchesella dallaii TaxID=48710 RepID=A0ABP1R0S7_9HEXA
MEKKLLNGHLGNIHEHEEENLHHIVTQTPWPNGYGVGLRIRRLWVRVPSESIFFANFY